MYLDYPLDPTTSEFRLINLLPSSNPSDPIKCFFLTTSPTTAPPYEALSYNRNGEIPTHQISLGETIICVSGTLHSALQTCRSMTSSRYLWVEEVCINHADLSEKSSSVLQIFSILHNAEKVIIYLGPSNETMDLAFNQLQILNEEWNGPKTTVSRSLSHLRKLPRLVRGFLEATATVIWDSMRTYIPVLFITGGIGTMLFGAGVLRLLKGLSSILIYGILIMNFFSILSKWKSINKSLLRRTASIPSSEVINAISDIFTRPYLHRIWSIQEISASLKTSVLVGDSAISWATLQGACARIQTIIDLDSENPYMKSGYRTFQEISTHIDSNRRIRKPRNRFTKTKTELLSLVAEYAQFDTEDPRDKIYAVLGLANEFKDSLPSSDIVGDHESGKGKGKGRELCVPDYKKPIQEIYTEIITNLITTTNRLDILRAAPNHQGKIPDLPSWVADWTSPHHHPVGGLERFRPPFSLPPISTTTSNPKNNQQIAFFSPNSKTLILYGFRIGTLKYLSPTPSPRAKRVAARNSRVASPIAMILLLPINILRLIPAGLRRWVFRFCGLGLLARWLERRNWWGMGWLVGILVESVLESSGEEKRRRKYPLFKRGGVKGMRGEESKGEEKDGEGDEEKDRKQSWRLRTRYKMQLNWDKEVEVINVSEERGDVLVMFLGAVCPFLVREVVDEPSGAIDEHGVGNGNADGKPRGKKWKLVGQASIGGVIDDTLLWREVERKVLGEGLVAEEFVLV